MSAREDPLEIAREANPPAAAVGCNGPQIRPAGPADHASFLRLVQFLVPDEPLPDAARYEREIMPTTLVAEEAGKCLGYTHYRVYPDRGHLGHLVSAPEARRRGVARALMSAAIVKLKEAGSTTLTLNVRRANAAARALYDSFGLKPIRTNRAVRLPWSAVPMDGPAATVIAPEQDAELEARFALAAGTLPLFRTKPDRVLLSAADAVTIYDTAFGGSAVFKARSLEAAWTLLRGIRPYAPDADGIFLSLDDDEALANALIAAGAALRMELLFMSASI